MMGNNEENKNDVNVAGLIANALGCDSKEFSKKYRAYKKAEADFQALFEPFKTNLLELHKTTEGMPKNVVIDTVKVTYVAPSVRRTIDSKKFKEEEPELAEKFTKVTNVSASVRLEGI